MGRRFLVGELVVIGQSTASAGTGPAVDDVVPIAPDSIVDLEDGVELRDKS